MICKYCGEYFPEPKQRSKKVVVKRKYCSPKCSRSAMEHSVQIVQKDLKGNLINTFKSINEAGRVTKTNPGGIKACLRGQYAQSNNFIWERL